MLNRIAKIILLAYILINNIYGAAYADESRIVADELNALYNKTGGCNIDKPDYYCSGIILHAETFESSNKEPWYLPNSSDKGSFSYIRQDTVSHTGMPIWYVNWGTGYILTPREELIESNQYPYDVYCSFPMNGSTNYRTTHGCGDPKLLREDYSSCSNKGVFSIGQYMERYAHEKTVATQHGNVTVTYFDDDSCSFAPDKTGFQLSMDLSTYLLRTHPEKGCKEVATGEYIDDCISNNELVISAWPKEKTSPLQVPIKAYFVLINGGESYPNPKPEVSFRKAFKASADYSKATQMKRQIPVVTIDIEKLKKGEKDIFAPANVDDYMPLGS